MEQDTLLIGWTALGSKAAAEHLARRIVDEKLAICVQIDANIQSIYRWQGELKSEHEWRLMIKFLNAQSSKLLAYIEANHPYDVPEWVVVCAEQVAPVYFDWAMRTTL